MDGRHTRRGARLAARVLAAVVLAQTAGCYVLEQGFGQLGMLARRQSIAQASARRDLAPAVHDRLELVWFARNFAVREIGLRAGESFQDVVWLRRDAASYVVAAAPRDSLEPYRWCFPVAGCLPYIGYFDRRDAEREAARLTARGYDTYLRGVSAYSLGGWLPDPVYSPLLSESRTEVVNTVIHEMTHGTVFLPGEARFNEGLATFVGDQGALLFFERRYGPGSRILAEARAELRDQRRFESLLSSLTVELTALYGRRLGRDETLRQREAVFQRTRQRFAAIGFESEAYRGRTLRRVNNAYLATNATYFGAGAQFEAAYERLGRDLPRFVRFIRDVVARQSNPEAFLTRWSSQGRAP